MKIYHNPRCTKSRQTLELLKERNIDPEVILYLEKGLKKSEIEEILKALKSHPREIIRKGEDEYKEMNLNNENLSDEELINSMVKVPKLLERPIVINEKTGKAAIGRPPENVIPIL